MIEMFRLKYFISLLILLKMFTTKMIQCFRYSLAFLNTDTVQTNESFVRGCSFHDGFNVGIGVYGTNNLTIENNVLHHCVGPCIDLEGSENKLLNNLVTVSIAEGTYKVKFCE